MATATKKSSKTAKGDEAEESTGGNPSLMNLLESQGEKGSVQILGKGEAYNPEEVLSTGSLTLDMGLGRGGIMRGKVVQIYGPNASGKSTIALNMIANIHKWFSGPESWVPYFDAEYALDRELLRVLGVDPKRLPVIQPESLEDFINRAKGLLVNIKEGKVPPVPMIVLDSVAGIRSMEYDEKGAEKRATMAPEARIWAERLPQLVKLADQVKCTIVLINQSREKKKSVNGREYIEYYTPGGDQIRFANSINIFCKQYKGESEIDKEMGAKTLHGMQAKIEKNKTSGGTGTKLLIRWRVNNPISAGWGLHDVLPLLKFRDDSKKADLNFNPETFISAIDEIPYARGYNWDKKTDAPKSSQNYWMIRWDGEGEDGWEDILDAIRTDEPEFDDGGYGGIGFAKKSDFIDFVDKHPRMGELISEYVRDTLNIPDDEDFGEGETDFIDPEDEEYLDDAGESDEAGKDNADLDDEGLDDDAEGED